MIGLSVSGLRYAYPGGPDVLHAVDLAIQPGERVAIVGQNGAGKTTLVRHWIGLLRPTAGTVQVGDWDATAFSTARLASRVGYVFQNPDEQLFSSTVEAEIGFGPRNLGLPAGEIPERISQSLEAVGLTDQRQVNPYDLTASQRKLVALAAVLAMDTPALIFDEPTTGQDRATAERIGQIIDSLHAAGKTVLAISHDMDFCAEHFDRLVVMVDGRIALDGPIAEGMQRSDILTRAAVEAPQIVRLAQALGWTSAPLTPAAFIERWNV